MPTGTRQDARKSITLGTILIAGLSLTTTGLAATVKLNKKQLQVEQAAAKSKFTSWLQTTFTQCGESYFAKSTYYPFVYEFVGLSIAFGYTDQSIDELNRITTVNVPLKFSATKSRMSARPDTLLWLPGLRALNGSAAEDVNVKRVNSDWSVEPGSWYYQRRLGPIPCNKVPASMKQASPETMEEPIEPALGTTDDVGEANPKTEKSKPDTPPGSDNDWYLIAALACERKNPSEMLALGKALGVSMSTRDVWENGKVVATAISASDGSSAQYYRGKARCEAALTRETKDLDRYK